MAVGALADQMEKPFIKYMEAFLPILVEGLSNNAEYQVRHTVRHHVAPCRVCTSVVVFDWSRQRAPC